jgi:hypothetical protein
MDYSIEPDEKLKRKLDYFYSPYHHQYNMDKYMTFNEDILN